MFRNIEIYTIRRNGPLYLAGKEEYKKEKRKKERQVPGVCDGTCMGKKVCVIGHIPMTPLKEVTQQDF